MKIFDVVEFKKGSDIIRGLVIGIKQMPKDYDAIRIGRDNKPIMLIPHTETLLIIRDSYGKDYEINEYSVRNVDIRTLSEYSNDELLNELKSRVNVTYMVRDNVTTLIFK